MAGSICNQQAGKNWIYSFEVRHPDLSLRWANRGESKRASGLNRTNVNSFFEELAKASEGVLPDNIWNCDEKGLQANGGVMRWRVIVGSDQKDPKMIGDES